MSAPCRLLLGLALALLPSVTARAQGRVPAEGLPPGLNGRSLPPLTPPRGPRRTALCIGIDGYQCEGYPPLRCATADAKELGQALAAAGFDVTVMTDDADDRLKPTFLNLDDRLTRFFRQADDPDDTVVLAFFGHGDDAAGQAALLPLDFGQTRRPVPVQAVIDGLTGPRCLARKKFLILDTCRSSTDKPGRRLGGGFVQAFVATEGFAVVTGCGENQSGYEDVAAGKSRFAQVLLDGLSARKAFSKDHEFLFVDEWAGALQTTFRDQGFWDRQSPQLLGRLPAGVRIDVARRDLPNPPPPHEVDKKALAAAMEAALPALTRQDYLAAVDAATAALRTDGRYADAWAVRATAYGQLGYHDKALSDADTALSIDPENAIALQAKGVVEFNGSAYAAAWSHLSRASALVDALPGRWPMLEDGSTAADRWLRLGYLATRPERAAESTDATRFFTRVIAAKGATGIQAQQALVNRVGCYTREGKAELAVADSTTLIRMKHAPPELTAKALISRAFSYGNQGKPDLEASYYTTVLSTKDVPADLIALALFNRGVCYGEQDKAASAIADYTAVTQLKDAPPDRVAEALLNRGLLYGARGKSDLAAADFTSVIGMKQAPVDQLAKALVNRGICANQHGKPEQELADYSTVILTRGAPTDELAAALIYRGILETRLGKPDQAIADYTAVINMKRAPAEKVAAALANRGWRYYSGGRLDEAAADSRRAAEINPADPRPAYNVGLILARQGNFAAACDAYQLAIERSKPDDEPLADLASLRDKLSGPPETGVFIGWLSLVAGNKPRAARELTTYLNKYPNGPLAPFVRDLLAEPVLVPK